MKYVMGDIEVSGTPAEIAAFLAIGAAKKSKSIVKESPQPKAKRAHKNKAPHDFEQYFGMSLRQKIKEVGVHRPMKDILESLHQAGLPRKSGIVEKVKPSIWVSKSAAKKVA